MFFILNLQIIDLGLSFEPAEEGIFARQSQGTVIGIISNNLDSFYPFIK
jgi:hypothetical protein